jgi:hypothetical protein
MISATTPPPMYMSHRYPRTGDAHPLDQARRHWSDGAAIDQLRSVVEAHEHPGEVTFGSSAWLITARGA